MQSFIRVWNGPWDRKKLKKKKLAIFHQHKPEEKGAKSKGHIYIFQLLVKCSLCYGQGCHCMVVQFVHKGTQPRG